MLPTFVIGLREGLEAALIVSIVATFLKRNGRSDLLRWVFAGVLTAVMLCTGVGVALDLISRNLPQKQQEGLETVIGAIAVAMVTYMVVWMRRHSRDLKGQLEGAASAALASGSGIALVVMAFLAVLREGFETAVFLLAAFNESTSGASAGLGAVLGVLLAMVLGFAIYRGGVRLNLSKFFRATGVVLVLVAAGLVVTAFHTAHEAGWINFGQTQVLNLTAVVRPGSVQASLLTGMLGIQERPTTIELMSWLAYLIPVGLYIGWPPGRPLNLYLRRRIAFAIAGLASVVAITLLALTPSNPNSRPATEFDGHSAQVVARSGSAATITSTLPGGAQGQQSSATYSATLEGKAEHNGMVTQVFTATIRPALPVEPSSQTLGQIAARNGGRLPLGANAGQSVATRVPVSYTATALVTWWVAPVTDRIVDIQVSSTTTMFASLSVGKTMVGEPTHTSAAVSRSATAAAMAKARPEEASVTARHSRGLGAVAAGIIAGIGLLTGVAISKSIARRPRVASELHVDNVPAARVPSRLG